MTNKISSQQALCLARMAKVERAQKAILDATKENKESDSVNDEINKAMS